MDRDDKVCGVCPTESMFHTARKTKQPSVRACGSLQHSSLIMQEVRGNSLLWATLSSNSLFDCANESDTIYTY